MNTPCKLLSLLCVALLVWQEALAEEGDGPRSPWPRAPDFHAMPTDLLFEWSTPSFIAAKQGDADCVDVSGLSTRIGLDASINMLCEQRGVRFLRRDEIRKSSSNEISRIYFKTAEGREESCMIRVAGLPGLRTGAWSFSGTDHTRQGSVDTAIQSVAAWVEETFPSNVGSVFLQYERAMPLRGLVYTFNVDSGCIVGLLQEWSTDGSCGETSFSSKGDPVLVRNRSGLGEDAWVAEVEVRGKHLDGLRWVWDSMGVPLNATPWRDGKPDGVGLTFSNGMPSSVRYVREGTLLYEGAVGGGLGNRK